MFKKLLDGELPLIDTFWKFGIMGTLTIKAFVKIFGLMLAKKLGAFSIFAYYTSSFRNYGIETSAIVLTILYLSFLSFLLFYAGTIVLGTWRSSAEYNRSLWFRHLSRVMIVLWVIFIVKV